MINERDIIGYYGIFFSMLKNHLNQVSYAPSMPSICDGWFLTVVEL